MDSQLDPDFEAQFDLFDHRQTQNMWAETARWRRDTPVVRLPGEYTYVARWEDCWRILRDPETFENGNSFKAVEMPDEERMLGEMDPPRHPRLRRGVRGAFGRNAVEVERDFAAAVGKPSTHNHQLLFALPRNGKPPRQDRTQRRLPRGDYHDSEAFADSLHYVFSTPRPRTPFGP